MSEHTQIYLAPACHEVDREWCQDDVWGTCDDCGEQSVRYVLASDHEKRVADIEAELAKAVELIKQAKPLVDLLFYGGSMDRQSGERVKELFHMFARHGDKS